MCVSVGVGVYNLDVYEVCCSLIYKIPQMEEIIWGWGNGSVGKALEIQS